MNIHPLEQSLKDFFTRQTGTRHWSVRTLESYRRDLHKLMQFMQQEKIEQWNQLNHEILVRFWGQQRQDGIKTVSLQRQASALRCFWSNSPELNSLPLELPLLHRSQRRLPEVPDVDRLQNFFAGTVDWTDPHLLRDLAMLELFYSSGLRLAELAALQLEDIDLQEKLVTVTGKGSNMRIVPLGQKAVTALQAWIHVRQLWQPAINALFISQQGKALGHRAIQKRLALHAAALGMPLHPHLLRHAFASHLLESSGDLRAVQELLGHQHISTTALYTHLDFQHLAQVYDQSHPHANRHKKR